MSNGKDATIEQLKATPGMSEVGSFGSPSPDEIPDPSPDCPESILPACDRLWKVFGNPRSHRLLREGTSRNTTTGPKGSLRIQMFSGYVSCPLDSGREKFHICTGFSDQLFNSEFGWPDDLYTDYLAARVEVYR